MGLTTARRGELLRRLRSLRGTDAQIDVLMTHDWPHGIATATSEHARTRPVGNTPCREILETLQPALMVCGHMHTRFRCTAGETTVRCLGKVPSSHSCAVFELLSDADGKRHIREVEPCDPLPAPCFAAEDSDV